MASVMRNEMTVPVASLGDYAVPRLIEKYLEQAEDRQKN